MIYNFAEMRQKVVLYNTMRRRSSDHLRTIDHCLTLNRRPGMNPEIETIRRVKDLRIKQKEIPWIKSKKKREG